MKKHSDFSSEIKEQIMRAIYRGPDNEIPSAIYDAISILYASCPLKPFIFKKTLLSPKEKLKPQLPENLNPQEILHWIMHRPKLKQTWCLVIHLPPGIDFTEFKSREPYFSTAIGNGSCEIERNGKVVLMTISNILLNKSYPFEFDPYPYLKKMSLPILLGYSASGPIIVDMAELVTILTGGLRGSGKSVLFHGAIYSLLRLNTDLLNPKVIVCIIDPKIKEFKYFEEYGAIWVHDMDEIRQLLEMLDEENERRQDLIGGKANNIIEYHALGKKLPFVVVVADEVTDLGEDKNCRKLMIKAVRKYRSQGIYVWAATQRPSAKAWGSSNEFSEFKSQFESRVCFRTADPINSQMILDSNRASSLPKIPGRAIYKFSEETEIQVPYFPSKAKHPKLFHELMDQLPKVALPYHNIEGEVYDYEPNYPLQRTQKRSAGPSASRSLRGLISGANTFA